MKWLRTLAFQPERFWRWVMGRLWHDRLAFQYERGYAQALRDATAPGWMEHFRSLTPEEQKALLDDPSFHDFGEDDEEANS